DPVVPVRVAEALTNLLAQDVEALEEIVQRIRHGGISTLAARKGTTSGRLTLDSACGRGAGGLARGRAPGMEDAALPDGACAVRPGAPARRRRGLRRRAASVSRAVARRQRAGQARQRPLDGLPRLPRPALDGARADEGWRSLRPRGDARRV